VYGNLSNTASSCELRRQQLEHNIDLNDAIIDHTNANMMAFNTVAAACSCLLDSEA